MARGSRMLVPPAACPWTSLQPLDLVAVAFSKGLGAPGWSMLAGSKDLIASAVRHRQRLGGAMRQNGIFAAAALHALDFHLSRLAEDRRRRAHCPTCCARGKPRCPRPLCGLSR
jgi:threonine aldolase